MGTRPERPHGDEDLRTHVRTVPRFWSVNFSNSIQPRHPRRTGFIFPNYSVSSQNYCTQNIFCCFAMHYFCRGILSTLVHDVGLAVVWPSLRLADLCRHRRATTPSRHRADLGAQAIFTKLIHFAQINYAFFPQLLLLLACTILCVQVINFDCVTRSTLWADLVVLPTSIKLWRRLSVCPCVNDFGCVTRSPWYADVIITPRPDRGLRLTTLAEPCHYSGVLNSLLGHLGLGGWDLDHADD